MFRELVFVYGEQDGSSNFFEYIICMHSFIVLQRLVNMVLFIDHMKNMGV